MDYRELIRSAIASLKANVLRTSLTMLGIVIGISSVILIVSIGQGAVTFVTNELSSFGTNVITINPGQGAFSSVAGADTLTTGDVEAIEKDKSLTNVKTVVPNTVATVRGEANGEDASVIVYGSVAQIADVIAPDIIEGEFFNDAQVQDNDNVVVVGVDTADEFFGKGSSVVGETLRLNNKRFRIIGGTFFAILFRTSRVF